MEEYKRHNIATVVLCVAGICLNLLLNMSVIAAGIPLYLNTVGTVIVSVSGGYLPGVIVGFATNIIECTYDPSALFYGSLNVLIALAAARMADKGWMKRAVGIIGAIPVFTLIGGGLGAVIQWFTEEMAFSSEQLNGMLYSTGYFNPAAAHLASSIIMDLPDKVVTVLIAAVILRLIPEKYWNIFSFRWWLQSPVSGQREISEGRSAVRRMSLLQKMLIVLILALTTVAIAGIVTSYEIYKKAVIHEHTRVAQGTAETAAGILDGDMIDEYLERGEDMEEYRLYKSILSDMLHSSTDIVYLYVYKIEEDGCHVVFDIDSEGTPGEETGTVIPFDEGFKEYLPSLLAGKEIEPVITDDTYGYLLTAYQPVYDSNGVCVCYVGADIDMAQLIVMEKSFLTEMIAVFLGFFIMICVFVIWLMRYGIVYPVGTMTRQMDDFLNAEESQESIDKSVKDFRSIDIHTGDEVEMLYRSICALTAKQAEQMRNIRHFSESTAKMQDGLIITMADLVENRDSDTGAHIQKTAAYVKIIVEGLKRKGYYAEKITPKFMSDIVRSAPLHDVGKINIPDGVLNKPGKLTDEEYEIMKMHTVMGGSIIEKAISTVEGENYLKEARNMARYHHERWDGKGYPDRLHGEVIPLSARIMAVADVFDALTSPRVYKPAFPLDKAISMIQEGAGSQFDAKCVEVFLEALPEVKVVLRKYNEDANA